MLLGALRGDRTHVARVVLGLLLLAGATAAGCWALLTLTDAPTDVAQTVILFGGSALTLGFALAPLIAGASDPLDPRRFAVFGLRERSLAGILLARGLRQRADPRGARPRRLHRDRLGGARRAGRRRGAGRAPRGAHLRAAGAGLHGGHGPRPARAPLAGAVGTVRARHHRGAGARRRLPRLARVGRAGADPAASPRPPCWPSRRSARRGRSPACWRRVGDVVDACARCHRARCWCWRALWYWLVARLLTTTERPGLRARARRSRLVRRRARHADGCRRGPQPAVLAARRALPRERAGRPGGGRPRHGAAADRGSAAARSWRWCPCRSWRCSSAGCRTTMWRTTTPRSGCTSRAASAAPPTASAGSSRSC